MGNSQYILKELDKQKPDDEWYRKQSSEVFF